MNNNQKGVLIDNAGRVMLAKKEFDIAKEKNIRIFCREINWIVLNNESTKIACRNTELSNRELENVIESNSILVAKAQAKIDLSNEELRLKEEWLEDEMFYADRSIRLAFGTKEVPKIDRAYVRMLRSLTPYSDMLEIDSDLIEDMVDFATSQIEDGKSYADLPLIWMYQRALWNRKNACKTDTETKYKGN